MIVQEHIPPYFKVYLKLKKKIVAGEFEKGPKIGAISDLAKMYGVASETMRRAIHLLEVEGLVNRRRGFGTVIPETANLYPIEWMQMVFQRKVTPTFLASKVHILSTKWVTPNPRLMKLYNLEQGLRESQIYEIFFKIDVSDEYRPGLKGLVTHHFSEGMLRELNVGKDAKPWDILVAMVQWLDATPHTFSRKVHPWLCIDEDAKLLDLPDGTPVFHEEFYHILQDAGLTHLWEMITNANIVTIEADSK